MMMPGEHAEGSFNIGQPVRGTGIGQPVRRTGIGQPVRRTGIGQPVRRTEDRRFLVGQGQFVADMQFPGQAFATIVYAPHAHATITRIDSAAALALPGVLGVLTAAEAERDGIGGFYPLFMPSDVGGPAGYRTLQPLLAPERVRFVGERVAVVVAETLQQSREGAERVAIDYDILPAVVRPQDAARPDAPLVWPDCEGNLCYSWSFGDAAATAAAFAAATHRVSLDLVQNRLSPSPIEPRAAIGRATADGRFELYTTAQNTHGFRRAIAQDALHIPESCLRVIAPDVGGGFGLKGNPHPEDALVLWAARRCGRPVKWVATRSESMMGDRHGRDHVTQAEMALDVSGRILAIRTDAVHAVGAYLSAAATAPAMFSLRLIPSVYRVDTVHLATRAIFTHTSPVASYRGAGRPEANYVTERLLDRAAAQLGLPRDEIRRRNLIQPGAIPHRTPTGMVYDSGDFPAALEQCLVAADWHGFARRRQASQADGLLRGRGLACYIEYGGMFNDRMELRFDSEGGVTIVAGTHSHGQGHATAFAQIVAEWLGVPFGQIRYLQGDSSAIVFGRGSFAGRSALIGSGALRVACDRAIEKGRLLAAHMLEAAAADIIFADGRYAVAGTDRGIALPDVARASFRPAHLPAGIDLGLEASGTYGAERPTFPNGCHVCEVEIDPQTGAIRLDRYTVIDDVGRPINPMICEGQVHGGVAQGVGQALMEQVVYDRDSGQLLTGSFQDYCMPRASDFPAVATGFNAVPSPSNPLGVKGVGESGTVGAPPAVISAVLDALAPLGVTEIDMPATPHSVWQAIRRAELGSA